MNKYGKWVVLFSILLFVCWAKMPEAKADTASLHGTVGNTMGIDISTAYVDVSLYDNNGHFLNPTTLDQATGAYSFTGISTGTYQISISLSNATYRQDVTIAPGDNVFDYTFAGVTTSGYGTVSGKMYLPGGKDGYEAKGYQITLHGKDAVFGLFTDYSFNSYTNEYDGSFIFYNVPPGNYAIEGYKNTDPYGGASPNITVVADGSIFQNIYLSLNNTAKQISGRITDTDGNNVSANVYLYDSSGSELLSRSIGPYYYFSQLNSGTYIVKAATPDGEYAATQEVALTEPNQTVDLQLTNAAPYLTWSVYGSYMVGSQLSVVATGYSDAEADPAGTPLYQWLSREHGTNDFYPIPDATDSSYTIRPEDAGKDITVFVTPVATKGTLQGQPLASPEVQVQDLSGFEEALPASTPVQDEPFSLVLSGAKDFNGGTVNGTFEVKATSDGTVIADEQVTFANGAGTLTGLSLDAADDQTVYVQVIGATTPRLVTVTLNPNQAPTLSVSLSGDGTVGSTITANVYNYSDAEGDLQDVPEYQWMTSSAANGTFSPISGAMGDRYTAQLGDFGNYVAVAVTPKALRGTRAGAAVISDPIYIAPGPVSFRMEPSLDVHAIDAGQLQLHPAWIEDANAGVPADQVAGISYTVNTDAAGALLFSTLPGIDAGGKLTFNALPDVKGDAAVSVSMKVSLLGGTVLQTEAQSFVIHINTMHVAISGVENGKSYNTTVTPAAQQGDYTVTLTKYWYNGEGTTSQVVDNYTLGNPISDEGQYVLDVEDNGSGDFVSYAFAIDRTAPIVIFYINDEQTTQTTSRNVVLYAYPTNEFSYQDLKIMVSDNGADWSSPQPWSEAGTSWQLPEGDGNKTVYVKLIDSAGNVSEPATKTINLNTSIVPSSNADLSHLSLSVGSLNPAFASSQTEYTVYVDGQTSSVTVTAEVYQSGATLVVNGLLTADKAPRTIQLDEEAVNTFVRIVVTASDGMTTKPYTINIVRGAAIATMSFQNNSTVTGIIYGPVVWTASRLAAGDSMQVVFMDNQDNIVGQPVMTIAAQSAGHAEVPATAVPAGATKLGLVLFSANHVLLDKQSTFILESGGHDGFISMQDVLSVISGHSSSLTKDQIRQLLQQITSRFVKIN